MTYWIGCTRRGVLLLAAAALPLAAQAPRGSDTLSAKSVAESLAVIKTLDGAVRANPKDAAAWFRRGMVAWSLSYRAGVKPTVASLEVKSLERLADSSLQIAARLEPANARYPLTVGIFLHSSSSSSARLAAPPFLTKALDIARTGSDPALRSAAAIEVGRISWLEYDARAYRRNYACSPPIDCAEHFNTNDIGNNHPSVSGMAASGGSCENGMPSSIDSAAVRGIRDDPAVVILPTALALNALHNKLIDCTSPLPDAGASEYAQAEALFREALTAAPNDARVFRQMAMLLAEKNRWQELQAIAHDHASRVPGDPWGWLVLGLAMHRSGASDLAVAAFDTGTARLEPRERARLFAFSRMLSDRDSTAYAHAAQAARDNTERSFWAMAAPLWSRKGNDPRTEFLARVTFAELRWTVEELGVRGADSDRGEMHIRYGPPDVMIMIRGNDLARPKPPAPASMAMLPGLSDVITFWDYNNGLSLVFWGPPTYGTAHFPITDQSHVSDIVDSRPVSFDNVAAGRVDAIPLTVARFRAAGDSVDLLFASQAPVAAIRAATSANTPVREDTWLFGRDVPNAYRDTVTLDASGLKAWSYRVPQSTYMYRVEATADGAMVAGRAMTWVTAARDTVTGFATRGFGISDVLLATRADPRGTPARWRDFDMAPLIGSLPKQSNLEFIWENYELGQRGGQAQYHVTLTIQRERSAAGKIAAAIIGAIAGAVKIDQRSDRVIQQFDRSMPYAPTLVDHVTMALGDTPAGTYRLTLEITDAVSGRKTSRTSEVTISDK